MSSIRNIVGLTAAAGGLGALIVLASLPATAAGNAPKLQSNTVVTQQRAVEATTPSTACTDAKNALAAWKAKDKANEDAAEKANANAAATDKTAEDPGENATAKQLREAVFTKCASPACVADVNALKDVAAKDKTGEDATEKASGTEKSTTDKTEDKTERDSTKALRTKLRTDCAGIGK